MEDPIPETIRATGERFDLTDLLQSGTEGSSIQQFFRANKAMFQFKNHPQGVFESTPAENIRDNFLVASQHYYHVKDWAKSDPLVVEEKDWEHVVDSSFWMRAAADIANASKHGGRDPPRGRSRSGQEIMLSCVGYEGSSPHTLSDYYRNLSLVVGDRELHPADFLEKCYDFWDEELVMTFMRENVRKSLSE